MDPSRRSVRYITAMVKLKGVFETWKRSEVSFPLPDHRHFVTSDPRCYRNVFDAV